MRDLPHLGGPREEWDEAAELGAIAGIGVPA